MLDLARLYAAILRRYPASPDLRIIGEYAVVVIDHAQRSLRLARSPLRAPPLHFHHETGRVIAASVPRVLLAAGVAPRLDPLKLADNAWFNYASDRSGWYEGTAKVPLGSVVEFNGGPARTSRYYDPLTLPRIRLPRREDYVEQARVLLDEAVAAALDGFERPGVMLSGGLDSSLVTVQALNHLPDRQELPAFTFVPQADWDGRVPRGTYGDERPYVDQFAKMYPRVRPHYVDNHGLAFDHRMAEMFHLTGVAPINLANYSPYHEPWRAAKQAGCDVLLIPQWGNETFSNAGEWGTLEYFLGLRWGELAAALRASPDDPRPLWRRFVGECLLPLLPPALWRQQRSWRGVRDTRELASPLRADYVAAHGLNQRGDAQGGALGGAAPRSQRAWLARALNTAFEEASDVWQGFEQLYGVAMRDPAAYRPLAEFCFGLPTDIYLHQGERRWLARELARGVLPEAQRTNPRSGRHHPDWLAKLAPRRTELRAELDRLEQFPELAEMLDFPRLKAALDDWPSETPIGEDALPLQVAVTRGLTAARFINYVSGRNC
ncbi:MAG: asparagine synthase-related protein [Novosphingobium sp.]